MPEQQYTQGYSKAFTSSHASRTAEIDAGFLLPYLKPDFKILDFGCGPETISLGLGRYVPEGSVTAIDISPEVLEQANEEKAKTRGEYKNARFYAVDIVGRPFTSDQIPSAEKVSTLPSSWKGSFDVIYGSQCLIHLDRPIEAIQNLIQCLKPGGIMASRDYDIDGMFFWPDDDRKLALWGEDIRQMTLSGGTPSANAARDMPIYFRQAGFSRSRIEIKASVQVYSTPEQREWWGGLHAARWEESEKTRQVMMNKNG